MSRTILKVQYEYPFEVFGIVSSIKDYRLCHCINKALLMSFSRADDLTMVMNKQGDDTSFSLFKDDDGEPETFILIGNKGSNAWFFPEIKNVDYLFIVRNPGSGFDSAQLLKKLRIPEVISGAYPIEYEKFKSRENLLYLS
jgi:hypothetical protein